MLELRVLKIFGKILFYYDLAKLRASVSFEGSNTAQGMVKINLVILF